MMNREQPAMGSIHSMQSVVTAAMSVYIAFSLSQGRNALQDAAKATLTRLYQWRSAETIEFICKEAVANDGVIVRLQTSSPGLY